MSSFVMKLPDVGEGVAEAELVEWLVAVGDEVTPETIIAEVLTDKATVEVSSPVAGTVSALHGEPGDVLAVGSDLVEFAVAGGGPVVDAPSDVESDGTATDADVEDPPDDGPDRAEPDADAAAGTATIRGAGGAGRALAAPAVRARATRLGIDLAGVAGSGPDGRVLHADLDALLAGSATSAPTRARASDEGVGRPVRGLRRRIATRLTDAWRIPHITYVDSIDATELERLRAALNAEAGDADVRLTMLPFVLRAVALAVADQPGLNAHYDHEGETLTTFEAVHVGVATQTDDGLIVPVVRHVEALELRDLGRELRRVTDAARDGSATRHELSGSTITVTSLGALGGVATTPILNPPEVAIVGINKLEARPVWRHDTFERRDVFNVSASFDHRMVDGWDAAVFVQRIKTLLETPALLFV